MLTYWGIGYNQMLHGQHNTISIINLHLLTGNLGRKRLRYALADRPAQRHERAPDGRPDGTAAVQPAAEANEEWRDWIADVAHDRASGSKQTALLKNPMAIGMMERAARGRPEGNVLDVHHAHPPARRREPGPARAEKMFCVVQEIYRHAPNLLYGDVIFPAITWGEWTGGTYIQSERRVYVCDGVSVAATRTTTGAHRGPLPDLDLAIDKCKSIAKTRARCEAIIPYEKKLTNKYGQKFYDPEDVFEDIVAASQGIGRRPDRHARGARARRHRLVRPAAQAARRSSGRRRIWTLPAKGGTVRRYMHQEGWADSPYGNFRHTDGKAHFKLCEQDYGEDNKYIKEVTKELSPVRRQAGRGALAVQEPGAAQARARDLALVPELPDLDFYDDDQVAGRCRDRRTSIPFWLGLGIVYEHFHTAKTIRGATTTALVPEQYVEMSEEDAKRFKVEDGERVRVVTRRSSYEGRVSVGTGSIVRPARNEVPAGYLFSPWNLSVADSADPKKNRWLVNAVAHRLGTLSRARPTTRSWPHESNASSAGRVKGGEDAMDRGRLEGGVWCRQRSPLLAAGTGSLNERAVQ